MNNFFRYLSIPILVVGLLATAQAEENRRQYGPWVWGLSGGALEQLSSDFSDGPGDFSVSRNFGQVSLGYAWDRRNSVSLSLGAGRSEYDFAPEVTIEGLEPWSDVRDYRLSIPIRFSPTERSDVIIIPGVRTYAESGANRSDGKTGGVIAGFSWKFSDSLSIGPGFGWYSELGDDANAFPILIVDWKLTEKLSLTTGRGLAASQGPGLSLNYQLAKGWKLGVTSRYEKVRFTLDDRASGPKSVGEDKSLPLLLVLEYSPWPMTTFSAIVGAEFEGSLRMEDASGRRIAQSDFETAPVVGLTFSSRF